MKKLNNVEVNGKYQREISNRFPVLETFDDSLDINSVRENIRVDMKTSAKATLGYHKSIVNHGLMMNAQN